MYRQFFRLCSSFRHLFHTLWSRIRHSHPLGGGCMLDSAQRIFRINRVGFDISKMAREIERVSSLTRDFLLYLECGEVGTCQPQQFGCAGFPPTLLRLRHTRDLLDGARTCGTYFTSRESQFSNWCGPGHVLWRFTSSSPAGEIDRSFPPCVLKFENTHAQIETAGSSMHLLGTATP